MKKIAAKKVAAGVSMAAAGGIAKHPIALDAQVLIVGANPVPQERREALKKAMARSSPDPYDGDAFHNW